MTIPVSARRMPPYAGNGVTTSFAYNFYISADSELLIVEEDDVTEVRSTLVLDTDYTVTGVGAEAGGNVVLTDPLATGKTLYVIGNTPLTQPTDFKNQSSWQGKRVESSLDRIEGQIQELYSLALKADDRVSLDYDAGGRDIINIGGAYVDELYVDGVLVVPSDMAYSLSNPAGNANEFSVVNAGGTAYETKTHAQADVQKASDIQSGLAGVTKFVTTVADMKALTGLVDGVAIQPLGYANAGDFHMRRRRFVQTGSPPADDGGAVIHDTAGAGYYSLDNAVCFDLREYGVDGDDTDDSAQIQKAITKLDSGNGGKLVVTSPPVRYRITANPITIDGDVNLTLQGQGMPEFRTNYTGTNAITAGSGPSTHQGFVTLSEVALWGDGSSVNGFKGNYLANLKMYSLSLYQLGGIGVYVDNCYTFRLENTQINNCGITGAYVTGASMNGAAIIGSKFLNHNTGAGIGVHIEGPTAPGFHYGGLIGWCDFEFNTVGIKAKDCSGLTIAHTYFEENTHHILVSAASNVDNIAIRDCQFLGPGKVELNDVSGVTLDNLVFWGTGEVLTLNNCTNIKWGRLHFPNGGTIGGTSLSKYEYQAHPAWQSFATTWTASGSNPSLGDGTLDCYWMRDGNTCTVRYVLTVGASTTFGTGTWRFSTPFTAKTQAGAAWLGNAHYRDSSVPSESFDLACRVSSGGTFVAIFNQSGAGVTGTSPITWATGDQLWAQITYETA